MRTAAAAVVHEAPPSQRDVNVFLVIVLFKTTPSKDSTQVCVYKVIFVLYIVIHINEL